MKVAIQVLSTLENPSTRNIQTIKETYISYANELKKQNELNHSYDFYFYYADESIGLPALDNGIYKEEAVARECIPDPSYENVYNIKIGLNESIYNTFEKGIIALKEVPGYDWYLRTNISCYINIVLLDKVLTLLDKNILYCTSLNTYVHDEHYVNDIYPRGDFMLFSADIRNIFLSESPKYWRNDVALKDRLILPHVDDVTFGLCLISGYGSVYVDHLKEIVYSFIPQASTIISTSIFKKYALANRIKTVPPNVHYSGYSWEDNAYREYDVKKMKSLNNMIKLYTYSDDLDINELFKISKQYVSVKYIPTALDKIMEFAKRKKRN